MNNLDNLINKDTGEEITASTNLTWLWVFLLGPIHHLFNGRILIALVYSLLILPTVFLVHIYFLFWCRTVNRSHYLKNGFIPMSKHEEALAEKKADKEHKEMMLLAIAAK